MNTRLQVEQPVTEEITGLDLVQWQLLVAAGQPLPLTQDQIAATGHAMEVRVYAEDPYAGFLPQAGHVLDAAWPERARVETDLGPDQEVSTAYDPMLGKIVVVGADREEARRRMLDALDDTGIFGVTTNLGFVRRLVASAEFAAGEVHTAWLDSDASIDLLTPPSLTTEAARAAALLWASFAVTEGESPWSAGDGWRSGADPAPTRIALVDESGTSWEFGFTDDDELDGRDAGDRRCRRPDDRLAGPELAARDARPDARRASPGCLDRCRPRVTDARDGPAGRRRRRRHP